MNFQTGLHSKPFGIEQHRINSPDTGPSHHQSLPAQSVRNQRRLQCQRRPTRKSNWKGVLKWRHAQTLFYRVAQNLLWHKIYIHWHISFVVWDWSLLSHIKNVDKHWLKPKKCPVIDWQKALSKENVIEIKCLLKFVFLGLLLQSRLPWRSLHQLWVQSLRSEPLRYQRRVPVNR